MEQNVQIFGIKSAVSLQKLCKSGGRSLMWWLSPFVQVFFFSYSAPFSFDVWWVTLIILCWEIAQVDVISCLMFPHNCGHLIRDEKYKNK